MFSLFIVTNALVWVFHFKDFSRTLFGDQRKWRGNKMAWSLYKFINLENKIPSLFIAHSIRFFLGQLLFIPFWSAPRFHSMNPILQSLLILESPPLLPRPPMIAAWAWLVATMWHVAAVDMPLPIRPDPRELPMMCRLLPNLIPNQILSRGPNHSWSCPEPRASFSSCCYCCDWPHAAPRPGDGQRTGVASGGPEKPSLQQLPRAAIAKVPPNAPAPSAAVRPPNWTADHERSPGRRTLAIPANWPPSCCWPECWVEPPPMSPVAAGASGSSMSTGSGMERRLKKNKKFIYYLL